MSKTVEKFKQGQVTAKVRKHMVDDQSVYTVKVTRPYMDKHGKVKHTTTLRHDDCTDASLLLAFANEFILTAP